MDIKKTVKYFISCGAIIFTALSLLTLIPNASTSENAVQIVPQQYLYMMMFSFILSLGNTLRKIPDLSQVLGWVLHAVCYIGGFFLFVLLGGKAIEGFSTSTAAIGTLVFAVIYAICIVAYLLIKKFYFDKNTSQKNGKNTNSKNKVEKINKKSKEKESYKSMFS